MKATILFVLVFFQLLTIAQEPVKVQVLKDTRLINGRECTVRKAVHFGEKGKLKINSGENNNSGVFLPDKQHSPSATHHITFHTNPPINSCWLILNSADNVYSQDINNGDSWDVEDGYYQLAFLSSLPWAGQYRIILDDFHVYKDMDTTLNASSTTHQVNLEMEDINGNPLFCSFCEASGYSEIITFKEGSKYPDMGSICTGWSTKLFMLTDIPEDMGVLFGRSELTRPDYQYYIINYPVLTHELNDDTILSTTAEDLHYFPLIFNSTPAGNDFYYGWGYGTIENSSLLGSVSTFVPTITFYGSCPSEKRDTVFFYTNHIDDSLSTFFASCVDHSETDPAIYSNYLSPVAYLYKNDDLIFTSEGNYPPVNSDYHISPGNDAEFGVTAPFNITWSYNPPSSPTLAFSTHFRGETNERRYIDQSQGSIEVWHNGLLVWYDTLHEFHQNISFQYPGLYIVVMNDSNYTICGRQGYLKTTLSVDNSEPVDPDAPTPISFKILQGDSLTQEIVHGYPASVRFTAGDYQFYYNTGIRVYHSIAEASLFYKESSAMEYLPLGLVPLVNEFDSLSGMPYFADLSPVQSAFGDSVWVDLKMQLVDSTGNICIQEMHPAFLLRDVIAGESSKYKRLSKIFPNPATDYLIINYPGKDNNTDIFSPDGKFIIHKTVASNRIDISELSPGLYVLKITDKRGNVLGMEKVVRCK